MMMMMQVKDARSGPGLKSMTRIKSRQVCGDVDLLMSHDCDAAKHQSVSRGIAAGHMHCNSTGGTTKPRSASERSAGSLLRNSSSMFIDSDYWTP